MQSMDWLFKKERIYLLAQFWQQVSPPIFFTPYKIDDKKIGLARNRKGQEARGLVAGAGYSQVSGAMLTRREQSLSAPSSRVSYNRGHHI